MTPYDLAIQAAERGDWDEAIRQGRRAPASHDPWQVMPSAAQGGIPPQAAHKIIDFLTSWGAGNHRNNLGPFLYEYSGNLPKDADPELLNRMADMSRKDYLTTENILAHPNWKPDAKTKGLMDVGEFWNGYERKVEPHHFATIKSFYTGQPVENLTDHRGAVGHSLDHTHILPHLPEYAGRVQEEVLKHAREWQGQTPFDEDHAPPRLRYFGNEPYVKVYRGVSGHYGKAIADKAGLDFDTGHVDRKTLTIPVAHFGSWSTSKDIAKRFATTRSDLVDQPKAPIIIEKWLPVKHILHSGFHTVVTNQDHAHPNEHELIFGHPEGSIKVPTSALHVVRLDQQRSAPGYDHYEAHPAKVRDPKKLVKSVNDIRATHTPVINAMLGHDAKQHAIFEAARFLAGKPEVPATRRQQALWQNDGSHEKAALSAYGLEVNEKNLQALRAVLSVNSMSKSERTDALGFEYPLGKAEDEVPKGERISPLREEDAKEARAIRRAFDDHYVIAVEIGGKHSKGSLIARDPETNRSFLLKPGSGGAGPAAGVRQEKATPTLREGAFWSIAERWALGDYFVPCAIVWIDGREYAAMDLLPPTYDTLEERRQGHPSYPTKLLQPYMQSGTLHQWAFIDYVLGNPDRHAQNIMVGPQQEIKLIDHGSAFAGEGFNPAFDRNSFVPFYLRAWGPEEGFNGLSVQERLRYLPVPHQQGEDKLRAWLDALDDTALEAILTQYGIDPEPSLERFIKLRTMAETARVCDSINRCWVTGA